MATSVQHATEVRVMDPEDRGTCARDKQVHRFVQDVVNGSTTALLAKGGGQGLSKVFTYRCIDVPWNVVRKREHSAPPKTLLSELQQCDVEYLAALPSGCEDLIPLTEQLGA
eukprot:1419149-Amphidinium_carterae.1